MSRFVRSLQLLTIAFWVGGIAFFAFVLAPAAFHNLPSAQQAGLVVRASILSLHRIGLVCGAIFLAAALLARRRRLLQVALVALMLVITLISQQGILPQMERDRLAAVQPIEALPHEDPHRVDFDRLHALSEQLEGAILFLGLAVIVLLACEPLVTEP